MYIYICSGYYDWEEIKRSPVPVNFLLCVQYIPGGAQKKLLN